MTASSHTDHSGDDPLMTTNRVGRRYWGDPEFHARVKEVVQLAQAGQPDDGFDRWHKDSLTMGAALALDLAEARAAISADPGPDTADQLRQRVHDVCQTADDAHEADRRAGLAWGSAMVPVVTVRAAVAGPRRDEEAGA